MVSPWVANNENSLSNVVTKSKTKSPGWVWTDFQVELKLYSLYTKCTDFFLILKKNVFPWPSQPYSDCHPSARNKFLSLTMRDETFDGKAVKINWLNDVTWFHLGLPKTLRQMCGKVKNKIPWVWTDFEVELKITPSMQNSLTFSWRWKTEKKSFFPDHRNPRGNTLHTVSETHSFLPNHTI